MDEPRTQSAGFNAHSFIIKIWLDEAGGPEARKVLHGYITYVPSGVRRHIRSLDDVLNFIEPYLEPFGEERNKRHGIVKWLSPWMRWMKKKD